jgi:TldD protein
MVTCLFFIFLASASDAALVTALETELQRSQNMHLEDYGKPYFVAYAIDDVENAEVIGRDGEIVRSARDRTRPLYVELRIGDYKLDNTAGTSEPSEYYDAHYTAPRYAPLSDDPVALRRALWALTDEQYKGATSAFLKKKGSRAYQLDPSDKDGSFTKETKSVDTLPVAPLMWERARVEGIASTLSKILGADRALFDHNVQLSGQRRERHLVTTEGTRLAHGRTLYSVQMTAYTRAKDGVTIEHQRAFYAASPERLPTAAKLEDEARGLAQDLKALAAAKTIDPYTGPALLAPEATGVLFHEALGHRLEGERQKDQSDGQTFKGQVGHRFLPAFISVYDDPTLSTFEAFDLNGHYRYDDEGVPAQKVTLIDRGVLRSFLLSRTPIEGFSRSNGHGRAEVGQKPRARMANTIVTASESVSDDALKKMLMAEAKKQKKPYGLLLRDVSGGQTSTETGGYQAFKGAPRMVYTVDVDTGVETLVRGVEIVGTPLSALSRIIAASNESRVFNGFCGAESGYVPVSTLAPAILLSEIELQRTTKERQRAPILDKP